MVAVLGLLTRSWRVALLGAVTVPLSLVAAAWTLSLRGHTLTTMTVLGLAAAVLLVLDELVGDVLAVRRAPGRAARRGRHGGGAGRSCGPGGPRCWPARSSSRSRCPRCCCCTASRGHLTRDVLVTYGLAALVAVLTALPGAAGPGRWRSCAAAARRAAVAGSAGRPGRPGAPLRGALAAVLLVGVALAALPRRHGGPVLPPLQARDAVVRLDRRPGHRRLAEMDRVTGRVAAELRGAARRRLGRGARRRGLTGATEVVDVNSAEVWVSVAPGADPAGTLAEVRRVVTGYPGLRARSTPTPATASRRRSRRPSGDSSCGCTATTSAPCHRRRPGAAGRHDRPRRAGADGAGRHAQPTLHVEVDLARARAQGLRPGDVRRETSTLLSGLTVGSLYEQQKVFDVVVQGAPATRQNIDAVKAIRIDTPSGAAGAARRRGGRDPRRRAGGGHPRLRLAHPGRHRDTGRAQPADVAAEVTSRLRALSLPYEYHAEVLPGAAQQAAAHSQLLAAGVVALLLVLLLLQAATGSWRVAVALLLVLPLAAAGGVAVAPSVGGLRSAGVLAGLAAVVALAVRQSLVLLRRARCLRDDGSAERAALTEAAAGSAAPVLVVALAAAAVLLPAALAGPRAGLEVLQPMAVTVLAGLASLVVVVLGVVPALTPAVHAAPGGYPAPVPPTGHDGQGSAPGAPDDAGGQIPQTRRSTETEAFR